MRKTYLWLFLGLVLPAVYSPAKDFFVICPRDGGQEVLVDRAAIADIQYLAPKPPRDGAPDGHGAGIRVDADIPIGDHASIHIATQTGPVTDGHPQPKPMDFQIVVIRFRDGHTARYEAVKTYDRHIADTPPHQTPPPPPNMKPPAPPRTLPPPPPTVKAGQPSVVPEHPHANQPQHEVPKSEHPSSTVVPAGKNPPAPHTDNPKTAGKPDSRNAGPTDGGKKDKTDSSRPEDKKDADRNGNNSSRPDDTHAPR